MLKRFNAAACLFFFVITVCCLSFSIAGCRSKAPSRPVTNTGEQVEKSDTGLASYYSRYFDGKETASGKIFDSDDMVAAHPDYPLGTQVRLTNLENSSMAEVKIIDRGPTKENQREGVIIDISRATAKKLGMIKDGRVKVKVDVLKWGSGEASDFLKSQ